MNKHISQILTSKYRFPQKQPELLGEVVDFKVEAEKLWVVVSKSKTVLKKMGPDEFEDKYTAM